MHPNNTYIKTLDGWRAVAILAVIISHLKELIDPSTHSEKIIHIMSMGAKGVSLFFAISGFIIALKLFEELNITGTINFKKFYKRRFFRLYPTILAYLIVLSILNWCSYITLTKMEIISSLLSFRNYITVENLLSYTSVLWSLSVEEHFYLLLPSFLLFFNKKKRHLLALIISALLIAIWRKLGTTEAFISKLPMARYDMWNTFGRIDGMLYGVILAYIHIYKEDFAQKYLKKIPVWAVLILLISLYSFKIPLSPMLEAILYPLLIYSTIINLDSFTSRILETRVLIFIGNISYSLYIWHSIFINKMPTAPYWMQVFIGHWHSPIWAICFSFLTYKFIEKPCRNLQ